MWRENIFTPDPPGLGQPPGRTLRRLWPLALLALAAAVAGGCIPGCGIEQYPWSLVPYTVTLVLSFVQAWKLYKLTEGGRPGAGVRLEVQRQAGCPRWGC